MVEWCLRILLSLSNFSLVGSLLLVWWRVPIAEHLHIASATELHMATAGASVMGALFVQLFAMFYFIGSGLWMKEQAQKQYAQHQAIAERIWALYSQANRLKAKVFPFATAVLGLGLLTFILGGARQVGVALPQLLHPTLALFMLVASLLGSRFAKQAMRANVEFLDLVSQEIEAIP